MALLEISLLGGFEARLATGEPLRLKGRKTMALVAYLAIHAGEARSRDELIALLWGDRGEAQARSSLRQSLSELRKALGGADSSPLIAGRSAVALEAAGIAVDTLAFERLIDDGTPAALQRAAELYRGDLLDGIGVHDAGFEIWLRDERQRLKNRACDALVRLLGYQEGAPDDQGDRGDRPMATAQRLLALDPLREAGHRALMRIHAKQGDRTSALKQYRTCRDALAAELGIAPEAETEALAEQIRGGAAPPGDSALAPAAEALPLPDKPSIAVLPFANLSGDPSHEHFADCITEDIITALSKVPKLFVVARSSTFTYKGRAVEVNRVGREQGVRYVLEGSVQRGADRVRITAQLIDAASGQHIWAERYDRIIDDVFALQDEITREVTLALQIKLTDGEHARIVARGTRNLEAWELVLQANELLQGHHRHDAIEGRRLAGEALLLDETYGSAHGLLGWAHWMDAYNGWSEGAEGSLDRALEAAEQSLAMEPDNSETHALLAMIHLLRKQYDQALDQIEKATRLGPNNSKSHGTERDRRPLVRRT